MICQRFSAALLLVFAGLATPPVLARTHADSGLNLDRDMAVRAGVSAPVLELAMNAVSCGLASGDLATPPTLTLIDYSLPSARPRLWVFDLRSGRLLFKELVAHGRSAGSRSDGVSVRSPGSPRHVRVLFGLYSGAAVIRLGIARQHGNYI